MRTVSVPTEKGKAMYKSPINIYETAMDTIIEQRENAIFAKIQDAIDVQVDRDELIRALQYDRGQYEKGYRDGFNQAVNQVRSYLLSVIEEWDGLGDRRYELPNIQVYNHARKELDDLESYISTHFPMGDGT